MLIGLFIVFALLASAAGLYGWWRFEQIETVDVSSELRPGVRGGTNYLIVGTDSRAGVDRDNANAGVIFGDGITGSDDEPQRTDTIVILRTTSEGNFLMALPRDLFVPISGTGSSQRINAAIQGGPERLIATIHGALGIPIQHYVEVDFGSFLGLVEAVGGITIDFEYPAFDERSGLFVPEAGPQRLDADQALAFVRSRSYTEIVNGERRRDPTSDLGRVQRQQDFLRAVMDEVGGTRNPITLNEIMGALVDHIVIDDDLGFFEAVSLGRRLQGLDPVSVVLPTRGSTTSSGASVLLLADGSGAVLDQFR